jgi:cytochrome P450
VFNGDKTKNAEDLKDHLNLAIMNDMQLLSRFLKECLRIDSHVLLTLWLRTKESFKIDNVVIPNNINVLFGIS